MSTRKRANTCESSGFVARHAIRTCSISRATDGDYMSEYAKLRAFVEAVSGQPVPDASFNMLTRILDQKRSGETNEEFCQRITQRMTSHLFASCPVKLFVSPAVWAELKEADQTKTAHSVNSETDAEFRERIMATWGSQRTHPLTTLDTAEGIELDAFAWLYYDRLRADGETDEQLRAACRAKETR